ncbi:serine/threonine-protein kinase [Anatilimnocola floriformis]|uniref:serine/threonine-protein kinase n=1 Tax=Anatilimnocola floriformis TaxID=2948575 RepID=UPI0020C4737A|nr:serine/threonine-protein kinase [Anatilimnocola floriformis]
MSLPTASTVQLIAEARDGNRAALETLRDRSRGQLLAKPANDNASERAAAILAVIERIEQKFHEFRGDSEPELLAWLERLIARELKGSIASDATLVEQRAQRPRKLEDTTDLAAQTMVKPPSRGSSDKTESSDATLARPAGDRPNPPASPTMSPAMSMPPTAGAARAPARQFGNYDLVDTIAKGGMGIVYKAKHRKLNRIVALKMILSGQFADELEVQRFYAEAEAAARLRHPNIVGIHDIGECEGQHYFSMDYIEGKSLSDLLKDQALQPRHAAKLMEAIASAMHYAHVEGVVHRDLKPSNVLLDASGSPLITDFGLAKQVHSGGGQSQMTMSGTVVGTPSYMPPEQAAGKIELVNIRSDVYSLGAILYELLSGRPPFRGAGVMETLRQVLENEPVALRILSPTIPRDLETICHKCLQKEPEKRYATAKELADELGRFLRGEPILAQPISPVARGWRWCKRNPAIAAASAAALFGLIIALGATTVGYIQTSAALAESEESRRQAMDAVNDLFTQVSENTLLNKPGLQPLRKELLGRALNYYQRFLTQRAGDPRVQDELASTHFRIGLITEAVESTEQALPLYETARTMQEKLVAAAPKNPARLEAYSNTLNALGTALAAKKQHAEAQKIFRTAAEVRTTLAELQPSNSEYQRLLANTYMNLGVSFRGTGDRKTAREQFVHAQQIREAAFQSDAKNWKLQRDIGKGHYGLASLARQEQDLVQAKAEFASAAEAFELVEQRDPVDLENRRLLSVCYRLLGDLASMEDVAAARQWYEKARSRLKPLAEQNPEVVDYQVELAGLELNRGYLDSDDGQRAAAIAAFSEACAILAPLGSAPSALPRHRRDLAMAWRALGSEQSQFGQREMGLANLRKARDELSKLIKDFPAEADYAQQLQEVNEIIEMNEAPPPAPTPPTESPRS